MASSTASQNSSPHPRKRPRPVLSCLVCKRKKLKCDRSLPCLQCSRLGRANECKFEDRDGNSAPPLSTLLPGLHANPSDANVDGEAVRDLQKRVKDIEQRLKELPYEDVTSGFRFKPGKKRKGESASRFKPGVARKGASTRFYNHLNWKALHPEVSCVATSERRPENPPLTMLSFEMSKFLCQD